MTGGFSGHFKLVAVLGIAVTLSGCEEGQGPNFDFLKKKEQSGAAISTETPSQNVKGVEREVEKPDVFSANEPALWDGRPSLGGVWIAAPGVKDPERVIIRNTENGKSVVGALFRRERENPGPRLQLSSDAAVELGVLAGAPTKLNVVALRTETVAPVASPAPEPIAEPEPIIAAATAPEPTPSPTLTPFEETTDVQTASTLQPSGPADPLVAQPEPEPEGSPSSMPNIFKRGARQTQANASNGFDATIDAGAATATAATGAAVETASVTTQTLDPIKAAEAALDRSDAAIAQDPNSQTPANSFSTLKKPYIQIGIFAVQANADRAARRLNDAGVLPVVLKQQSAGRSIWRVIVGPARTKAEGRALQTKVKGLGYTDAYFVTD